MGGGGSVLWLARPYATYYLSISSPSHLHANLFDPVGWAARGVSWLALVMRMISDYGTQ